MRIFDSFIFFNELDLLEMRLNILNDVVDYFVLTESPWTVSGNPKPLYYQENKDRFENIVTEIIKNITIISDINIYYKDNITKFIVIMQYNILIKLIDNFTKNNSIYDIQNYINILDTIILFNN